MTIENSQSLEQIRSELGDKLDDNSSLEEVQSLVDVIEERCQQIIDAIEEGRQVPGEETPALTVIGAMIDLRDHRLKALGIESDYALQVSEKK